MTTVAEQIIQLKQNLDNSRQTVLLKGGSVGDIPAFDNLANEIESIPSGDANYVFVDDTDTAYKKQILAGAAPLAKLKSIGGMTYKCNNLIPFPYANGKEAGYTETINGITWTVNADGSITANGTSTASSAFSLWGTFDLHLPKGIYTLSGANSYVGVYITASNNIHTECGYFILCDIVALDNICTCAQVNLCVGVKGCSRALSRTCIALSVKP